MSDRTKSNGILSLALRLSLSKRKEQTWRRACLFVAGLIAALTVMSGFAVAAMVQAANGREFDRTAVVAVPEHASLMVAQRADIWRGKQFPVVYLEPMRSSGVPAALPPGLDRLPLPGEVAISPELARASAADGSLASRYPLTSARISDEGLSGPGELLAYARPAAGTTLAGSRATRYVSSFGAEPNTYGTVSVAGLSTLPTTQMVLGGLALLGVPTLLLLCAATATASAGRDRRLQILAWLGVRPSHLLAIVIVDAVLWAGFGAVIGAVGGQLLFRTTTVVPVLTMPVFSGDMTVAALPTAGTALIVLTVAALSAVLTDRWRQRTDLTRPIAAPQQLSRFRTLPMLPGLAIVLLALFVPGRLSGSLGLAGVILVVLAMPLLLPKWVASAGGFLQRRGTVSTLLAGRRLERFPHVVARPLFGLAGLTLLACCVLGFLAVTAPDESGARPDRAVVTYRVGSLNEGQESLERFRAALPDAAVFAYVQTTDGLQIGSSCADLARALKLGCEPGDQGALAPRDEQQLRAALGAPPGTAIALKDSVPPAGGRVLVLAPSAVSDADVRNAAARTLLGPVVSSAADMQPQQSPLVAWLTAALIVAGVLGTGGAVMLAIDGSLRASHRNAALRNLGLTRRRLAGLEALQFGVSYFTVIGTSLLAGLGLCYVLVTIGGSIALPWAGLALVAGAGAVTGLVICALIAVFGRISALRAAD
ncbi:hypothetical protein ACQP2X_26035 [Actinoplanes sp. CA-131856]